MRKMKAPAYVGGLFFSMVLAASLLVSIPSTPALSAQAPAAGAAVVVRLAEPVNSSKDPAGKQYRASVTKAVEAGNGVTIPQGAVAAVSLANSGSGWTTQLVSVTINGQPLSVASGPASVTAGVQGAASSAMSSVNSVLGAFGHHASAPAGAAAVAMGQRVVLPPGTTLTFVLIQPPSANPAAPAPPAGQPMIASSAPPPSPAASPSGTSNGGSFISCSTSGGAGIDTYYTGVFQTTYRVERRPNGGYLVDQAILDRFYAYLTQKGYKFKPGSNYGCAVGATEAEAQAAHHKRAYEGGGCSNCGKIVETEWKDGAGEAAAPAQQMTASASSPTPAESAAPAQAVPTAAANQRYAWCHSAWVGAQGTPMPAGTTMYFSDIFVVAAPPPQAPGHPNPFAGQAYESKFKSPYLAFLKQEYSYKSDSNYPVDCTANYQPTAAGLQLAQKIKQQWEDNAKQSRAQVVETGWKNTP